MGSLLSIEKVECENKRDSVICDSSCLELIQELHQQLSCTFHHLLARVENIAAKISEEKFTLVVVGQFKHGKSTLIDALVGENILPIFHCKGARAPRTKMLRKSLRLSVPAMEAAFYAGCHMSG